MRPRAGSLSTFVCGAVVLTVTAAPVFAADAGSRPEQKRQETASWGTARTDASRTSTTGMADKTSSQWPTTSAAAVAPRKKIESAPVSAAVRTPIAAKAPARPNAVSARRSTLVWPSIDGAATPAAKASTPAPVAPAASVAGGGMEATVLSELHEQRAQIDRLLQVLEQHKALIDQQRALLDALQPNAAAAPAKAASAPSSAPVSSPVPPIAIVAPQEKRIVPSVEAGFGKMKLDGLVQGWYSAGDSGYINSFRMRRLEIKFSGEVTPKARWTVMIDPAKSLSVSNTYSTIDGVKVLGNTSISQSSRLIQDAFITLDYVKGIQIAMGQFKLPLGLEGPQSSAALDTVERALYMTDKARGAGYGDVRDVGVTLRGKPTSYLEYQVGAFNGLGESQNDVAKINDKALVGRFLLRPTFVKGLQFGVSGAWAAVVGTPGAARHRMGAEMLWTGKTVMVKSEVMRGDDAGLTRGGYYVHVGVKVRPQFELIARQDVWDPNTRLELAAADATERDYIGGFNYYLLQHNVKFQFNVMRKTFTGDLLPSRTLFLGNMQTSW